MGERSALGISDLLRRSAAADPDRLAVVDGADRLTRGQLDALVNEAAAGLAGRGLQPGDRVGLQLPTGVPFVAAYLGALRAGLVAVPVNPAAAAQEVEYIRADAGISVHLDVAAARELLAGARRAVLSAESVPGRSGGADPRADRSGDEIAVLLYTSGTSGRPRAAMLSSRALLANLEQLAAVEPPMITAADVLFCPLPLSHVFGLNAGLGVSLHVGCPLVLADRFHAAASLQTMADQGVTAVLGVPGQYARWLREPAVAEGFRRVRFAMSGSTTLARALVEAYLEHGVVIHDGYGLTEAAPVVTVNAIGARGRPKPGSIGRPLPGVQVQLRDVDGEEVEQDDPGRIFISGANLFSGYWPDGADGPDADGWFGTGDIAVADADDELHLVGRVTDLVLVNGFNVYPAEVEAVFARLPGVAEVAVTGQPDENTGESVAAFVVPAPGVVLDPADLLALASEQLARFKVPSRLTIVDALPHTVTGKIMKWQLGGQA